MSKDLVGAILRFRGLDGAATIWVARCVEVLGSGSSCNSGCTYRQPFSWREMLSICCKGKFNPSGERGCAILFDYRMEIFEIPTLQSLVLEPDSDMVYQSQSFLHSPRPSTYLDHQQVQENPFSPSGNPSPKISVPCAWKLMPFQVCFKNEEILFSSSFFEWVWEKKDSTA